MLSFGAESFVFQFVIQNINIKIHRTIILPVYCKGCETWSLILRKEHRLRVFENRVLRIFGTKRDNVTGEWSKLHTEKLNELYFSPNIVRVIKWRRMRWEAQVARMVGKPERRDHLGDPDVDGGLILRWIFRKWHVGVWTRSSWLRIGTGCGRL